MYFNLSPTYDLQLLKADATVASTLSSDATIADLIATKDSMLSNAAFKIYEASSISGFSSSGYSTLKEYLEYLATTSSGSVVGTYYTDDTTNYSVNGTTKDGYNYEVVVNSLRQEHTYYIVETQAPANYPLSGKVVALYMANNGDVTVTVYGSTGTVLETYFYDYSEGSVTATGTSGTSFVYGSGILVSFDNSTDDIILAMAILNALEYELPSTGSTGLFPYERAGILLVLVSITGLLIIALSEIVQKRRMRMNAYKRGYNEEKAGREHRYAGTRDRPQQRNRIYGRDAPASFSDGSQERSRGTGPGTE